MRQKVRLGTRIEQQKVFEKEQQKLKKKFKVDAEGVIRIEKKPLTEVIIQYGGYIIRIVIVILLFALIAIGVLSLAYMYIAPEVPMIDVLQELINQFK